MRQLVLAGVIALFARTTVEGQGTFRASVSGVVIDASGAAIPGVTIDLVAPDGSHTHRSSATDGTFLFENAGPGRYEIGVEHTGFRRYSGTIRIGTRPPAPLTIRLSLAILEQKLDIRDPEIEVQPDVTANLDVVVVDRAALDNLPAFQHDVIGAISRFLDPAAVGSTTPATVVDGMEGSRVGVSVSAIQEVRINQNPYSAEFSRPGRSRLEIITKAGTPDYQGTFNFLFRDHHLDARNAFAATRPASTCGSAREALKSIYRNRSIRALANL